MKRIIKESITITEMIMNDNDETLIIDRKYSVRTSSELIKNSVANEVLED
jgi:hypothetical protein